MSKTNLVTPLKVLATENHMEGQKFNIMQSNDKSKTTKFIPTPAGTLFVGKSTDMSKPLFVIINDGAQNPDLAGSLWLTNSNVSAVGVLELL